MKICVIGPVWPYRGGIAHYTTLMAKTLAGRHEVSVISYSVQYPRLLYRRGEQKDYSNRDMELDGAEYVLNTVNPLSWIKTAARIRRIGPDLAIIPWWHPYFAPADWTVARLLEKETRVLFLCHNVLPHEPFPFQKTIVKKVLQTGDSFIVHSEQEREQIKDLLPVRGGITALRKTPIPRIFFFAKAAWTRRRQDGKRGCPEKGWCCCFSASSGITRG